MIKILHVVVGLDPALGGLPAVPARLAAAQAAAGHEVTLLAHDAPTRKAEIDQSLRAIPGIDRVKMVTLDPKIRAGWSISPEATASLRAAVGAAEVVHLHGVWDPLIRCAAAEARTAGRPYILAPHGMLDAWSLQQRWLKKKLALMLVFRGVLARAARLHVLNEDEGRLLKPLRLPTPSVVIPNGVFLEELEPLPPRGTFRAIRRELGDDPYILFLSRLHYKKGLNHLAGAFAQVAAHVPRVRLVVAGPDEGSREDFEQRIADAGLTPRVHVVGPLWGREKFAALVDATCFCLPSRQEGFSMAVTEAMACGLPVVISEACHFPEVARMEAGEVTPLDDGAIAGALERVLRNASLRASMGAAGRQLVVSRFTWPAIGRRAAVVYSDMLREAAK